jgi:hypothetical protein
VLRNITIITEIHNFEQIEQKFLAFLHGLDVKDLSLELEFSVVFYYRITGLKDWKEGLDAWIAGWDSQKWAASAEEL